MKNKSFLDKINSYIEKADVLSDIYMDIANKKYTDKKERDIARLKMELIKKELLLLSYLIDKNIKGVQTG